MIASELEIHAVGVVTVTSAAMAASAAWGRTADCSSVAEPQGVPARAAAAHIIMMPGAAHGLGFAAWPA